MELFNRVGRVLKAQLTHWQQQQEAPEELLERLLGEMELELIELRRALAQTIATFKSTERQRDAQKLIAQRWYEKAQAALDGGNEALARDALGQRQSYQSHTEALEKSLGEQRAVVEQVRGQLQKLERKYLELKSQKSLYLARLKSAIAAQKIEEIAGNLDNASASSLFERIETKILELEAERELLNPPPSPLDKKFEQWEEQQAVEATLAAMKARRPLPPSSP
ncbi:MULTISPECIES: PspA/IM30 family protein [Synechocystis]|uniref:PspA/IM30 family protein n=1 Tax=Synechocystis salina LEGE 00031 TaxID=1828736 RepID=A0ABR9VVD1_9SYNC|nr:MULTISPECIES: PspA/IM30 family protein [Synechocystis]MBD2654759.1 PspA/IM30 family protein [Synechocystis sp. FACHB-383]MBE9195835.1 PspA/IM30 family protein [Synechocystis sp. LEGE 06083]MBE9242072.1 PspA/IM30 family protein [Synechocystis salina LEGE 00041]MBE9255310.1 PspA/IM30 family protein [Synechocystis salina LEGE 00031]